MERPVAGPCTQGHAHPPKLQQVNSTHQTQLAQHLYASWSLSLPFSSQGLSGLIKIPILGWFFHSGYYLQCALLPASSSSR